MTLNGGKTILCAVGMYTPPGAPMTHFAVAAKSASIEAYGFNDISGNLTGKPW